jgi:hypothetical protein
MQGRRDDARVPGPDDAAAARIRAVRARVAELATRAGRPPDAVRIVAVTKTFPAPVVALAVANGLPDVGENYVQEARRKRDEPGAAGATWHLVGGLQRNKARLAVQLFDRLHAVDGLPLAEAVSHAAADAGRRMPVLVQVNLAGRTGQRGVAPDDAEPLVAAAARLPGIAVDGLMTIAPEGVDAPALRTHFRALRTLRDALETRLGVELPHLSMGMSDDFPLAIEEGATFVRLGRALFGERGGAARREEP